MAWLQICEPSEKDKGKYTFEIFDGQDNHQRSLDLSGQGEGGHPAARGRAWGEGRSPRGEGGGRRAAVSLGERTGQLARVRTGLLRWAGPERSPRSWGRARASSLTRAVSLQPSTTPLRSSSSSSECARGAGVPRGGLPSPPAV